MYTHPICADLIGHAAIGIEDEDPAVLRVGDGDLSVLEQVRVIRLVEISRSRTGLLGMSVGPQNLPGWIPDLHDGDDELVVTMFVTPRPGSRMPSGTVETPARVRLPYPVAERVLVDGALYHPA